MVRLYNKMIANEFRQLQMLSECLDMFWNTCSKTFKTCGIQHNMLDLRYMVPGYKFIYKEYTRISV